MFGLKSLQQICFSKRPQLTPAPPQGRAVFAQGCLRTRDQDRRPSIAVNILHSPQLPARPEEERCSEALNKEWVRQKIHPISIIASYGLDMKYIKELLTLKVDYLGEECLINSLLVILKTVSIDAAKDSADLVAKLMDHHNSSSHYLFPPRPPLPVLPPGRPHRPLPRRGRSDGGPAHLKDPVIGKA